MMRLFAKLTGGRVWGSRVSCSREARASARSPVSISNEVLAAIESAVVVARTPDEDDGPRVAVITPALFGAFIFSREEATNRITRAFPELSDDFVKRAVRYLENRARLAAKPAPVLRRKEGWVHGWRG